MEKNKPLSKQLGKWERAKKKQCYWNSWRIAQRLQAEGKEAVYVEGMVVGFVMSFEHGWVEVDGEIVDGSLPDEDLAYFAGLRFRDLGAAFKLLMNEDRSLSPIHSRYGYCGEESADFTRARLQAAIHEGLPAAYIEKLRQQIRRSESKE
jgi:hypothetical protein